jgi:uncharacterized SAM-binding protein YcdF (DUF218 family)
MFISLKVLLHTLLLPPAGPLLLATLAACLIASGVAARRAGWMLLIVSLASLWLLSMPAIANRLTQLAQRYPALDLTRPLEAQAIVILAGGASTLRAPEYGGAPAAGGVLLERLAYGAYVARHTALPVLVSGNRGEALSMQASLARDFHTDTRWVENHSRDTFENAAYSALILKAAGVRGVILVTDADHEWRAAHEFASAGLAVVPAPSGLWADSGGGYMNYVPNSVALDRSSRALYELIGDLARRTMAALGVRRQAP